MGRLARYTLRRILFIPVGVFLVTSAAFAIVHLTPGDPARVIGRDLATEEQLREIRADLGIDRPLGSRYVDYLEDLTRADLGRSFYTRNPVVDDIARRLPNTLELIGMSLLVAVGLGVAIGALGAYFDGKAIDKLARSGVSILQAIPDFFLGILLIYVVFFLLRWAPAPVGRLGFLETEPPRITGFLIIDSILAGDGSLLRSVLWHSLLPVLALGIAFSAFLARTTRNVLGPVFRSKEVEFARACGLKERTVVGYALREARTPILTYGAILLALLVGGSAIVETIFAWGGIGQWGVGAILRLDIPQVQGFILVISLFTFVVYVALDVLVAALDPRISYD